MSEWKGVSTHSHRVGLTSLMFLFWCSQLLMAGTDVGGMDLYRIVTMQSVLASTLLVQYVKEYSVHNPLPTCPHSTPQGTFNLQVCLTLVK